MIDLLTPLVNFIILRQPRREEAEWKRRLQQEMADYPARRKQMELEAAQAQQRAERAKVNAFYDSIARERALRVPRGCVRDRYGTVCQVNPRGFGRRELGSPRRALLGGAGRLSPAKAATRWRPDKEKTHGIPPARLFGEFRGLDWKNWLFHSGSEGLFHHP